MNVPIFPPENENDNIEYKLGFNSKTITNEKINKLTSQMLRRLIIGHEMTGSYIAKYIFGIYDNGELGHKTYDDIIETIDIFKIITRKCNTSIIDEKIYNIENSFIGELIFKKNIDENTIKEHNICLFGYEGSGKSTYTGYTCYNILDDGYGNARIPTLKHKHEKKTGITSSISENIIGIHNGNIIYLNNNDDDLYEDKIIPEYYINFCDLPGNYKFIKTTISGLFKYEPKIILVFVDITNINENLKYLDKYFKLIYALSIKIIFVFTKCDLCEFNYDIINLINNKYNIILTDNINHDESEIFFVKLSNISCIGHDILFNYMIPNLKTIGKDNNLNINIFQINNINNIPNMGSIISGFVLHGNFNINNKYFIGPFKNRFHEMNITNIFKKNEEYNNINKNEFGSLVGFINKKLNKNLILVDNIPNIYDEYILQINNDINNLVIGRIYQFFTFNIIVNCTIININENLVKIKTSQKYYIPTSMIVLREDKNIFIGKIIK